MSRQRRFIAIASSATCDPAQISAQFNRISVFAERWGFECVDRVELTGRHTSPFNIRPAFDALLSRKEQADDFDAVIFCNYSRLSREATTLVRVLFLLTASGITAISLDQSTEAQPQPCEGGN